MFAALFAASGVTSEQLVECASMFSPVVEATGADTVVFDVAGLGKLHGTPERIAQAIAKRAGMQVNVAIASSPDAAVYAARGFAGVTVIPPGEEAARLGSLPLELLPLTPELWETFDRWGIRTFHDLAALPDIGVAERLGEEGVRLQRLARGESARPVAPVLPPETFEETMELEHPLALLEPLAFILSRFLHDLSERLSAHGLATNELRLRLALENGGAHSRTYRLPVPMRDAKTFLKLMQLDLDAHPPPAAVIAVALNMEPVDPRVTQNGLFEPLAPEPERLEITLARIAHLVGEDQVGTPEILDTHRPDAFRLVKPRLDIMPSRDRQGAVSAVFALRRFRPPLAAEVETGEGRPARVAAPGVQGKVMVASGPWRSSGDWWRTNTFNRDEWDIALSNGALYRIFYEREAWYVDGYYD